MTGSASYTSDDGLRRALGYIMESGAVVSQEMSQFAVAFTGSDVVDALVRGKPLGSQVAAVSALIKRHHQLGEWSNASADPAMLEIATGTLSGLLWLLPFRNAAAHEHWMVEYPVTTPPVVVGKLAAGPHKGSVKTTIPTLVTVGRLLSESAETLNACGNAMNGHRAVAEWNPAEATSQLDFPRDPWQEIRTAQERWAALAHRIDAAKADRLENWDWRDFRYAQAASEDG